MAGFIAMIFFDVLTHAAVSVLWGILVAIAFSLLLIFIIRGLYAKADITPLGWASVIAYGLLILVLATVMAGAVKLNSVVNGVVDAVAAGSVIDIPSWIATYIGSDELYSSAASAASDAVVAALEELSSSLTSTAWKMAMWMAIFSVLALVVGCRQAAAIQKRRVAPVRSRRSGNNVDDF